MFTLTKSVNPTHLLLTLRIPCCTLTLPNIYQRNTVTITNTTTQYQCPPSVCSVFSHKTDIAVSQNQNTINRLYRQHGDILSWGKEVGGQCYQLDRNLGQNCHIYPGKFYSSVWLAQTLLDRYVRVCGTMRSNRGIPRDLEGLEKVAVSVLQEGWRNGVSVEGPKTCVNDKYDPWGNNCKHGWKNMKTIWK
jgi:hypothetical protein